MTNQILIAALFFIAATFLAYLVVDLLFNSWLRYKATFTEKTESRSSDLFMFVDASKLFSIYIFTIIFFPLLVWFVSRDGLFACIAVIFCVVAPNILFSLLKKRRYKQFENQLPDALTMLSSSLHSGASLSIALETMVKESSPPLNQEFSLLLRETKVGIDFDTATINMEKRLPIQDLTLFLSAMRISREVGGNLAGTLESLAETTRRKIDMKGKISSLTAQGKLQGLVMSALPVLLIITLLKLEPDAMGLMFTTKIGWMVLGVIVIMQLLGFLAIYKITDIDI